MLNRKKWMQRSLGHTNFFHLNSCHQCSFDIFESSSDKCRFCYEEASNCIEYSYLPLRDKILRWYSNKEFCKKMATHWIERDHWLGVRGYRINNEIWDGSRFGELSKVMTNKQMYFLLVVDIATICVPNETCQRYFI